MNAARVVIEVTAGVIPGMPTEEYTKRFDITEEEWQDAKTQGGTAQAELLAMRNGQAQGYAAWMMMQPDRVNWVGTDWIWL